MYNKMIMDNIDVLKHIVENSNSFREILVKLGYNPSGGNYDKLKKLISKNLIDISHFKNPNSTRRSMDRDDNEIIEKLFIEDSAYNVHSIKRHLKRLNLIQYCCQGCGLGDRWNGLSMTLHLDHINGNNKDNRLENLRWLCPNCHSQTKTYAGRNKKESLKKRKKIELNIENQIQKKKKWEEIEQQIILHNIDFSKKNWGVKVANLLNKSPQYCLKLIKKQFPHLLQL